MKRFVCLLMMLFTFLAFCSCQNELNESSVDSIESSVTEESKNPTESSIKQINTLGYLNSGKMGDTDGPAFAVYSKKGFNGISVDLNLADMEIQNVLPDGRYVNGYTFLGIDVFNGDYWTNCIDAGLCWSGKSGGWHIFYNVYEPLNKDTPTWYESSKKLIKNGTYRLTLTITEDNYAELTVKSLTGSFTDKVKIEVKGAKADGSNTALLFNTALDYPENTKVDFQGKKCENWTTITLANSDKGLYLRKLHATNIKLFKNGAEKNWENNDTSARSIWPDKSVEGFDYSPTEVYLYEEADEYYINLDMNRK